jgi:hypothetical protein
MSKELDLLWNDLDATFFRYAHLTGAVELYMQILQNNQLQKAFSRIISGSEIEWKEIHRFMILEEKTITWYPAMTVNNILENQNSLMGYLYGITLSSFIGDVDYYLFSVLKNHFGVINSSGSSLDKFKQEAKIDLNSVKNGNFIYTILQERHKIEHNKAQIDRVFLERLAKNNVEHAYKEGDKIQKSHIDVLLTNQAIREFAQDIDRCIP